MQVELMSFTITLSQKGAKIIFNDWLSSVIAETIVKVTKYFENLDQFVCVDSLELDDTIDYLQNYNSLPIEESIAHLMTHKKKFNNRNQMMNVSMKALKYIFNILNDEINNEE